MLTLWAQVGWKFMRETCTAKLLDGLWFSIITLWTWQWWKLFRVTARSRNFSSSLTPRHHDCNPLVRMATKSHVPDMRESLQNSCGTCGSDEQCLAIKICQNSTQASCMTINDQSKPGSENPRDLQVYIFDVLTNCGLNKANMTLLKNRTATKDELCCESSVVL